MMLFLNGFGGSSSKRMNLVAALNMMGSFEAAKMLSRS